MKDEKGRDFSQILTINCPPFVPIEQLNSWLQLYREANPKDIIVSKSWSLNGPA